MRLMRLYRDELLRLAQPLVFRTRVHRWKSCTICRRISLTGILSCSAHALSLTQEEGGDLPKNNLRELAGFGRASYLALLEGVNDTKSTGS